MYLIFDTETTGLPKRWDAPLSDLDNWPRCVQLAWQLHDEMGELLDQQDYLIKPEGYTIPYDSEVIHGISTELAEQRGEPLDVVLDHFREALAEAKFIVGQNVGFDMNIMGAELLRQGLPNEMESLPVLDTCTEETALLCKIPGGRGGKFKLPTLSELHAFLFEESFVEAHNATADVEATTRCFFELIRRGEFSASQLKSDPDYPANFTTAHPEPIAPVSYTHLTLPTTPN